MTNITMIIQITREQQVEIEEYCMAKGLTFSKYFTDLHKKEMKKPEPNEDEFEIMKMCFEKKSIETSLDVIEKVVEEIVPTNVEPMIRKRGRPNKKK